MRFWDKSYLLISLFLLFSCSEQQTFDNSFKLALQQSYIKYCDSADADCHVKVNLEFDKCFEQSNFDTDELYQISKKYNFNQPKKNLNESEIKTFIVFSKMLEGCMIENMGSDYADNMAKRHEKSTKISKPTSLPINSSGLLIAIKTNGDIWINKDKVELNDFKLKLTEIINTKSYFHAVIIADRDSSTANLVSVMDQLKNAGIEDISIATNKSN